MDFDIPKSGNNKFTESDIQHFAQAFDILLEGAIQNHLIDEHGKLVAIKAVDNEIFSEGGND